MALQLHAITLADTPDDAGAVDVDGALPCGSRRVAYRELAAVVTEQPAYAAPEPTPDAVRSHRTIVDAAFKRGGVLPAPVGVVFRAADVLTRWMELHYVSLTGALEYVEDRGVARVHIMRADGKGDELDSESALSAEATESARALRRRAVATLPLRVDHRAGLEMGASFLVELDGWKEFLAAVAEQQDAHHLLRFDVTGPWAPYDFVRMQFRG